MHDGSAGRRRLGTTLAIGLLLALLAAACGGAGPAGGGAPTSAASPSPGAQADQRAGQQAGLTGTVRLYTSLTQDTVDAVVAAYSAAHPGVTVEQFRAPTAELSARIAVEQRQGEVGADVLWLTDPLSMQVYAEEGLLRPWQPADADVVDEAFREERFVGTRIVTMVLVHAADLSPAPASWHDLTAPAYRDRVAIPDPGFAGSAFGALGFFALDERFGLDYYAALRANGAVQVQAPGEVVTGVAEGRFLAGMTLDNAARTAIEKGSPIAMVHPEPGGVAMYSPIGVVATATDVAVAESFADFTLTRAAQEAIAATGWQPIRDDVPWPHGDGPTVMPDWDRLFDQQAELLEGYRARFGG